MRRNYRQRRFVRRARRGYGAGRKAIKLMDADTRMSMFGPTYLQRLANPKLPEQTPQQRWMRRGMNYRGEGDYWSDIQGWGRKYIPKGSFANWGGKLGGMLGGNYGLGAEGSTVGSGLGGALSKWVGFGDYGQPQANQIMAGGTAEGPMTVNASDDLTGDVFISHTEYIGVVNANTGGVTGGQAASVSPFNQQQFSINPGMSETFPFLSQIANNFEMYEIKGLAFQYKPLYGEGAGTTNLLGKVIMATNYDPTADPFISSQQMQNYDYACASKPSVALLHGVETANKQQFGNLQYVRTGPTTKNLIFTDIGTLTLATEGIQVPNPTTTNGNQPFPVGELWVSYRVQLSRAKLVTSTVENDAIVNNAFALYNFPLVNSTWQLNSTSTLNGSDNNWLPLSNTATTWTWQSDRNFIGRTFLVTVYMYTQAAKANSLSVQQALGAIGTYNAVTGVAIIGATFNNAGGVSTPGSGATAADQTSMVEFIVDCNPNVTNFPYTFTITNSAAAVVSDMMRVNIVQIPTPTIGTTNYDNWAVNS